MSKEDALQIIEKISKKFCKYCNGKGCPECFNTGKVLITSREISIKLNIGIVAVDTNLRKLESDGDVVHFVRIKTKPRDPPRIYLWKLKDG